MPGHEKKTCLWVSDQFRHKPGCTATEDGSRHEISDFKIRGIVLWCDNKGAAQLCACYSHMQKGRFSHDSTHIASDNISMCCSKNSTESYTEDTLHQRPYLWATVNISIESYAEVTCLWATVNISTESCAEVTLH